MKHLTTSGILALAAVSLIMRVGTAQAIPIPTIGAELATQIDQLTKHIDELKKVKDQIQNGIEQAKSMGDKLSMDMLKNVGTGLKPTGVSALKVPSEAKKIGLTEETLKEPEDVRGVVEDWHQKAESGNFEQSERDACLKARQKMEEELATAGMSNALAAQDKLASGEYMKQAQEAVSSTDDQMQLIGANTAMLKLLYAQSSTTTALESNRMASAAISSLCD